MKKIHHSQAVNFDSALSGHVDPRTGFFNFKLDVVEVVGNNNIGPDLDLSLAYSPLNDPDTIYGFGLQDNFTRYYRKPGEGLLILNTGESYRVDVNWDRKKARFGEMQFLSAKPTHFKVKLVDSEWIIYYKNGVVERLQSFLNEWSVVSQIAISSGQSLHLNWEEIGSNVRLKDVKDDLNIVLLKVDYIKDLAKTTFKIWPGSEEEHSIVLTRKSDKHLEITNTAVLAEWTSPPETDVPPAEPKWNLQYSIFKNLPTRRFLTRISTPTGVVESVAFDLEGHQIPVDNLLFGPNIAEIRIPVVKEHRVNAGRGGPVTQVKRFDYSDKNFLGYGGSADKPSVAGDDYLYSVFSEYEYTSTETMVLKQVTTREYDADKDIEIEKSEKVELVTVRTYNCFHLLVSEKATKRHALTKTWKENKETNKTDVCVLENKYVYEHNPQNSFWSQPAYLHLPIAHTTTWTRDGKTRSQLTKYGYDDQCNLIEKEDPDGTVTIVTYYSEIGEKDSNGKEVFPPDKNGFRRHVKTIEELPRQAEFSAFSRLTEYAYRVGKPKGDLAAELILLESEAIYSASVALQKTTYDYLQDTNSDQNGILTGRTVLISEAGEPLSERYSETYVWPDDLDLTICETAFKATKDALQTSKATKWSRRGFKLLQQTDALGNITKYTYDRIGRLKTRTLQPESDYANTMTHAWEFGLETTSQFALSLTVTDASNNTERTEMDGFGRILRKYFRSGDMEESRLTEAYTYDHLGRLTRLTSFDYRAPDDFGPENPENPNKIESKIDFEYDEWDQNHLQIVNGTIASYNIYDPVQRVSKSFVSQLMAGDIPDQTGTVETTFNDNGQPIEIVRKDLKEIEVGKETFFYDGLGRLRKSINEASAQTIWNYDGHDRVLTQLQPDGSEIIWEYEDLLATTVFVAKTPNDPPQTIGKRTFDGLGRVTETACGGRKTTLAYADKDDPLSPVPSSSTDAAGGVIEYKYDRKLNHALKQRSSGSIIQDLIYDKVTGRLTMAEEKPRGSVRKFEYKASGELHIERVMAPGLPEHTVTYGASLQGRLTSFRDPTGVEQDYSYGQGGRLEEIAEEPMCKVVLDYDGIGRVKSKTISSAWSGRVLLNTIEYDDFGLEATSEVHEGSEANPTEHVYSISQVFKYGRLSSRATLKSAIKDDYLRQETFDYHESGRIKSYTCVGDSPLSLGQSDTQGYSYDWFGNLTQCESKIDGEALTETFQFENSDPCQMSGIEYSGTSDLKVHLTYDDSGKLMRLGDWRTFTYDALGRLATSSNIGEKTTAYGYDGLDRLISSTVGSAANFHFYNSSSRIADVQPSAKDVRYFLLDGKCVAVNTTPAGSGKKLDFLGTDHTDTTLLRFVPSEKVNTPSFSPWGETRANELLVDMPAFKGEHLDPVSDFYLLGNGYRAYSPMLKRFTAPDSWSPFGDGGGNSYAYCDGDPVNRIDPSGHSWAAAAGMLVAAVALGFDAASKATERDDPEASTTLGKISFGLDVVSFGVGFGSLFKKGGLTLFAGGRNLARRMTALRPNYQLILRSRRYAASHFVDSYRGASRLNIIAHGAPGYMILGRGFPVTAEYYARNYLKNIPYGYRYMRTLICHSAEGGANSFAARLSAYYGNMPVKGFRGTVWASHAPEAVSYQRALAMWTGRQSVDALFRSLDAIPVRSTGWAHRINYPSPSAWQAVREFAPPPSWILRTINPWS